MHFINFTDDGQQLLFGVSSDCDPGSFYDGARVCVYGASYGGYAAMMVSVREPSMFKCAVGYSGRYDLTTKYEQEGMKGDARATAFLGH